MTVLHDPIAFRQHYGPWALVTGASSGIGEAFARLLAAAGFNLVVTARRQQRLVELAAELSERYRVTVDTCAADLGADTFPQSVFAACNNRDIGLIISNAGFGLKGRHWEQSTATIDAMVNVNCRAPAHLAHAFLPRLIARRRGGLIVTASVEAFFGLPGSAAYSASKAFAKALGEALYGETLNTGVDVLVLCPGLTDTEAPALQGYDINTMRGVQPPQQVAAQALNSLGKQPVRVCASWRFRLMIGLLARLPRRLTLKLAARAVQ